MAKSLCLTYFLWLVGGWLGLHHFYLGRDRQAFIWWSTAGGFFGLGWLRDLCSIPGYVASANNDPAYVEQLVWQMRHHRQPSVSQARLWGQIAVGLYFGYLGLAAIPEGLDQRLPLLRTLLVPVAVAVGVHMVGSIDRQRGSFKHCLAGAYLPAVLFHPNPHAVIYQSLLATAAFYYTRQYRRSSLKGSGLCARLAGLSLKAGLFGCLWLSMLYHNAAIVTNEGDKVYLRDAVHNFLHSPAWKEFKSTLYQLYLEGQKVGWGNLWQQFVESLDPAGEAHAYRVLELHKGASQAQITKQYRQLAREWHPDRFRGDRDKQDAQEKFLEIQKAYEVISDLRTRRTQRNAKQQ